MQDTYILNFYNNFINFLKKSSSWGTDTYLAIQNPQTFSEIQRFMAVFSWHYPKWPCFLRTTLKHFHPDEDDILLG
jgi:hypothetical protein